MIPVRPDVTADCDIARMSRDRPRAGIADVPISFHAREMDSLPVDRRRARGALTNGAGRFEAHARVGIHDGWDIDEGLPALRTEVSEERARSVVTRNDSPDIGFDRSLNTYRGCEHGCVYCFARPTHAYLGLSPGLDFETRLTAKVNAAQALRDELSKEGYEPRPIALGTSTDLYQPAERDRGLARAVIEVLSEFRHPLTIATKGSLVERDADLLAPMSVAGLARVGISVTTLDAGLARTMEPRAPSPARRMEAIRRLSAAGVECRVMISPVVPGLTDHEIEPIMEAAAEAGAKGVSAIVLRLPREVSPLFREWLGEAVPLRAARVMARVRELHGGRDYDAEWGRRFTGTGVWADLIARRIEVAGRRLGLPRRMPPLRCDLFAPPKGPQLDLFD